MFYSQKSYTDKLGTCSTTIAASGCAITSCCNLFPRLIDFKMTPPELNKYCLANGCYSDGCGLVFPTLAAKFGMSYSKTTVKPSVTCIAETNHWASKGVPQHFYMIKPDGSIIDPLDTNPDWKPNPYNVVSYRVFTAPRPTETPVVKPTEETVPKSVYDALKKSYDEQAKELKDAETIIDNLSNISEDDRKKILILEDVRDSLEEDLQKCKSSTDLSKFGAGELFNELMSRLWKK